MKKYIKKMLSFVLILTLVMPSVYFGGMAMSKICGDIRRLSWGE